MKTIRTLTIVFFALMVFGSAQAEDYVGEIIHVGFNFCPRGTAEADGRLLPISQNTALFSLYGTIYGGDGRTTFALPDLRGRVAIGAGQGPGLSNYTQGQKGGAESVTLSQNEMPSHTHTANTTVDVTTRVWAHAVQGDSDTPTGNVLASQRRQDMYSSGSADVQLGTSAATSDATATTTLGNTGGNQSHENRPPYIVTRYCVVTVGLFPSRN